jgi:hypothetical protein
MERHIEEAVKDLLRAFSEISNIVRDLVPTQANAHARIEGAINNAREHLTRAFKNKP